MKQMLMAAKAAKPRVAALTTREKNAALNAMADALLRRTGEILKANGQDVEAAKDHVSGVMLDRLLLTLQRLQAMA